MDYARLIEEFVDPYLSAAEMYERGSQYDPEIDGRRITGSHDDLDAASKTIDSLQPAIQRIARAADIDGLDPAEFDPDTPHGYAGVANPARRLRGHLQSAEALDEALSNESLIVDAAGLHHWAWEPAADLWNHGHYRNAVHAAATQVEIHLQAKLGRDDISGKDLALQAFNLAAPTGGKPRLRHQEVREGSQTYRSVHEGSAQFGAGIAQVIRNTAAHRTTDLTPEVALEQLVCVSYWARLIDAAVVVVASDDQV